MSRASPISAQRQWRLESCGRDCTLGLVVCWFAGCYHQAPKEPEHARNPPAAAMAATTPGPPSSAAVSATTPESLSSAATTEPVPTADAPNRPTPAEHVTREIPAAVWTELEVPEYEPALVWYRPRAPLFVITHGAGGQAEWHCRHFHRILDGRATLLCPRGKRRHARDASQGYYYSDHFALRREVLAVVNRFEASVPTSRPYVFAGYSQGATMGALAFAQNGEIFSQLLLVEGGYADWSSTLITQFQKTGGKAVLFVCGTQSCHDQASAAARRFAQVQIRVKVSWAHRAGHRPDGPVGETMADDLSFLLADDPRWQGFTPRHADYSTPRGE
jgi:predicted esterase